MHSPLLSKTTKDGGRTMSFTKLDAVNYCLMTIGESPINSLENLQVSDALFIEQTIDNETINIQSQGWSFNTEDNFILKQNQDGEIILPDNILFVDPEDYGINLVMRQGKLYDMTNQTFKINKDVVATIIWNLDFEDLPYVAKRYITVRSARVSCIKLLNDYDTYKVLDKEEYEALAELQRYETSQGDYNVFRGSYSVMSVLDRRR